MIEVDCRKCENLSDSGCSLYGSDADIAITRCAENCFANYKNSKEINKMDNTTKIEELFNHLLNAMQIAKDLNNDEIFEVLNKTGSKIADILDKGGDGE